MDYLRLMSNDGSKWELIPYCQFVLNDSQQVALIGCDFEALGGIQEMSQNPENKSEHWGKLSEQGFIFQSQLTNSLVLDGWDFKKCPDPEVMVLTALVEDDEDFDYSDDDEGPYGLAGSPGDEEFDIDGIEDDGL
jgi:hypothetical protein